METPRSPPPPCYLDKKTERQLKRRLNTFDLSQINHVYLVLLLIPFTLGYMPPTPLMEEWIDTMYNQQVQTSFPRPDQNPPSFNIHSMFASRIDAPSSLDGRID